MIFGEGGWCCGTPGVVRGSSNMDGHSPCGMARPFGACGVGCHDMKSWLLQTRPSKVTTRHSPDAVRHAVLGSAMYVTDYALHSSIRHRRTLPRWLLLTTGLYLALDQFTMKASDGSAAVAMSSVVPVVQFGATPTSHSPGYMSTTLPFTTVALPVSGDHTALQVS